jgi:hypothetical protein
MIVGNLGLISGVFQRAYSASLVVNMSILWPKKKEKGVQQRFERR